MYVSVLRERTPYQLPPPGSSPSRATAMRLGPCMYSKHIGWDVLARDQVCTPRMQRYALWPEGFQISLQQLINEGRTDTVLVAVSSKVPLPHTQMTGTPDQSSSWHYSISEHSEFLYSLPSPIHKPRLIGLCP